MRDPLLPPLIGLASGIAASRFWGLAWREMALCLAAFAACALLARWRKAHKLAYACLLLACMALGAGLYAASQHPKPELDADLSGPIVIEGCIVDPPFFALGREQFQVELAPQARVRVNLIPRGDETLPPLSYGQRIRLIAKLRTPRNFGNPGAFDYAGYLARQHIYWTASARVDDLMVQPGECGTRFWAAVYRLRQATLERIASLYPGDEYAVGMMEAILLGESRLLDKSWTDGFRRTGTYHALVISGLHVAVLAGFLMVLLRWCAVPEWATLLITALAAWLYAYVSGLSAPVLRAAGGFSFFLFARFVYRRQRVLNMLAAVAIAFLIVDPASLFDASFQLSFLSVAAIAWLGVPLLDAWTATGRLAVRALPDVNRDPLLPPRVAQLRVEWRLLAEGIHVWTRLKVKRVEQALALFFGLFYFAAELVLTSAVVQAGLAVPMICYFHRLSLSGLTANVLVVPALSLLVPVGFLAIFTHYFWAARCSLWLLWLSQKVVDWHLHWEVNRRIPDPPVWLAAIFIAVLLAAGALLRGQGRWRWWTLLPVVLLLTVLVAHPFAPNIARGTLELTAVDVGQGDGLLVSFPQGQIMLVDGGGTPAFGRNRRKAALDTGEDVISPYLWGRSVQRVDVVVSTHAHEDHTDGLPALIENFRPRELWTGANPESPVWSTLQAKACAYGVKIVSWRAGQRFAFGGTEIAILSPPAEYEPAEKPRNNDSLAFRIGYGAHRFLLTGDMEREMEARMVADGALGHIDVLKVAHHGSKTSSTSEFLDMTRPTFALISAGFENLFHHPHPVVLEHLEERHTRVLRTDQMGIISVRSDGRRLWVNGDAE